MKSETIIQTFIDGLKGLDTQYGAVSCISTPSENGGDNVIYVNGNVQVALYALLQYVASLLKRAITTTEYQKQGAADMGLMSANLIAVLCDMAAVRALPPGASAKEIQEKNESLQQAISEIVIASLNGEKPLPPSLLISPYEFRD